MANTAFVNLTTGDVSIERSDGYSGGEEAMRLFLGGRGYATKLLYDRVGPEVEPLSPENLLIFSIGPLGGTPWPTSGRGHVTFKSPLTGAYGHANAGGDFGAELAKAGFDALAITGQAESPVYLHVTDNQVEIRAADDLWGLEVSPASDRLEPLGKVTCIGPAGENLARIAAVMNDRSRAAGRAGGGAVMGSKRLKAVVVKASGRREVPPGFRKRAVAAAKHLRTTPQLEDLRRYGTSFLVGIKNISGDLPAKNHQLGQVPFVSKVDAQALDRYVVKGKGCYACPLLCGRVSEVPEGPFACYTGGPEYETIDALGPMTWLSDMEAIIYANLRCNELGLDTISTGVVIAFAMECHEKGLLDDEALSLAWGDPDTVLGLIERIAHRQGLGDTLAEGVKRAAERIGGGVERYAMHVKGLEMPRQEPRIAKGFGLGHVTSNRGADHLYALPTIDLAGLWDVAQRYFPEEIVDELMDTDNERYKADEVVLGEHYCALSDALGVCKFTTSEDFALHPDDLAEGLSLLWDRLVTVEELMTAGERIVNLERLYNVRQGMDRADDRLPERFTKEPLDVWEFTPDPETGWGTRSEEPVRAGAVVRDLDAMLDRYYDLRGWDREGRPTEETLERLGMGHYDVAQ
jgi:aldehyde:ferredoxin oxidoreductase